MQQLYIPINCGFHDLLLDRATRRSVVELVYLVGGKPQTKHTTFKDVYTKQKEEFLLLSDGEIIRLDHIVSVDGVELPRDNSCKV